MLKPKDSDPDWLKREREKESSLAGGVQGGDLEHVINSLQNGLVLQNEEQMNKLLLNAIMWFIWIIICIHFTREHCLISTLNFIFYYRLLIIFEFDWHM